MEPLPNWKTFLVEMALYALLLVAYFAFVLHFLGGWFKELFDHDRKLFAAMALLVMIAQAVGLDFICAGLLWLLRLRKR